MTADVPTGDEFRDMTEEEKINFLRRIDSGDVVLNAHQALDLYNAISEKQQEIYREAIEDLADWSNEITKIPGCLGELLNAVHAAITDITKQEQDGTSSVPSAHEYRRWFPVFLLARHLSEDLARRVDAIVEDPDAARARMAATVDRIVARRTRDPLEDLLKEPSRDRDDA